MNLKQLNLSVDIRHASVIKSNMGIINGFKYESDNLIDFGLNKYIMSNRAIVIKLPDDSNKDKEMELIYTRCTIKVPDNFKRFQGLKSKYIYKHNRKAVMNLSNRDIKKLSDLENLDDTSSLKNRWLKIIKGLDKAYAICFQDEQQVDDKIDPFIYEYFNICEERFNEINLNHKKLKNKYIRLFRDKYRYLKIDISDMCKVEEEVSDNERFTSILISENKHKIDRRIKIYSMNSTTLMCLSSMLEVSFELGKGITFKDKQTGDYYSIWVIGKTYNSKNIDKVARNKKLLCIYTTEAVNMLTKRESNYDEVIVKLKVINMINPNILVLKHDKNKVKNSIPDIQDYEFYSNLQKVPEEYYDPIMVILSTMLNRHNKLYDNESFIKGHMIYNFGFKDILESITTYNKSEYSEWDISRDSAKVLALLIE